MKKTILSIACAALMGVTVVPQESKAFGIINIIATGGLNYVGQPQTYGEILATTACIVLLPICILQDGTQAQDVMTEKNLVANGYTAAQAQQILAGHSEVTSQVVALAQKGQESNLKAVVATVSSKNPEYAAFVENF